MHMSTKRIKTLQLQHASKYNKCVFEYTDRKECLNMCIRHSQDEAEECGEGCKRQNELLWVIVDEHYTIEED
jgi:hypothetical protein